MIDERQPIHTAELHVNVSLPMLTSTPRHPVDSITLLALLDICKFLLAEARIIVLVLSLVLLAPHLDSGNCEVSPIT
jgi:hypothetical protein